MTTATGKPSSPPTPPPNSNSNTLKNTLPNLPTHPLKSSRTEASNKPSLPFSPWPLCPMGHGTSKQEPRMELRPGMKLIQLKIEELKRRGRLRKSSIVSTAELLRPEEREEMVDDDSTSVSTAMEEKEEEVSARSPETIADADKASEEKVKEENRIDEEENIETAAAAAAAEEEEEEKRALGFTVVEDDDDDDDDEEEEEEEEKGRKLGCFTEYADLPESPSFRFYCTDLSRDSEDDDSVKFGGGRSEGN